MQDLWNHPGHGAAAVEEIAASSTVFYTAPVVGAPSVIERQIERLRDRLHSAAIDVRRQIENAEMRRLLGILDDLRDRLKNPDGYRSQETEDAEDAFLKQRHRAMGLEKLVPDPTALLVIDEADRLKIAGLEQTRSIFDQGGIGMVLIGMPGLEKRLARYPQFYSRIGFVHEFRPLSASDLRQLLERHWTPPGVKLPGDAIDTVAAASIIRITGGNFRLLNRLLTQVERILEINALPLVTKEVVEAARENLVIGQAERLSATRYLGRINQRGEQPREPRSRRRTRVPQRVGFALTNANLPVSLSELFGIVPSTLFGTFALLGGRWGSRPCEEPTDGGWVDSE